MTDIGARRTERSSFQSPVMAERRRPRRPLPGEAWTYVLNGTSRRVTVSIIIPARNEAPNLAALFDSLPPVYEIILVDGNSVDGTIDVAQELQPDIRVLRQTGRGKGNAMIEGLAAARGDIAVFIDADGSNEPGEVERFVLALVNGADLAKGSRFLERGGSDDITGIRRLGNSAIRAFVNRVYGTRFTDLAYGFNALWTKHRDALDLNCNGFEIETLLHIRAARLGFIIEEVPSFEHGRSAGTSNLHAFRDGLRIAAVLTRELTDQYVNRRPASRAPRR